jgi:hypothetical protein
LRRGATLAAASLLAACGSSPSPSAPTLNRAASAYLLGLDQLKAPGFSAVEPAHSVDGTTLAANDPSLATALAAGGVQQAATVRYFRPVAALATANGPVDVRSTVIRCAGASGAGGVFAGERVHNDAVPGAVPASAGALGDDSHADQSRVTASDGTPLVEITLTWRIANLVSVLVVRGRDSGSPLADALILAHAQASGEH